MTVLIRVYGQAARIDRRKWRATDPVFTNLLNAMTLLIRPPIEDTDPDHTIATEIADRLGGVVITSRIMRELPTDIIV